MWFIGVEVEQENRTPPPKKSPGSALEAEYKLPRGLTIRSLHPNNIMLKSTDIVKITFT